MIETMKPTRIDELIESDKKYFLHLSSSIKAQQENGPEFIFASGDGVYLTDVNGERKIDGLSSLWNVNIGHGRKELGQAAMEQMAKLAYTSTFGTVSHEPAIYLAKKLAEITPGNLRTTFFTSGGSEATDSSFKLIRHYWKLKGEPQRTKVIARNNAYHGLTIGSTSATGIKHFNQFVPASAPDFIHVDDFSPVALREVIEQMGPESVAAFIAEPVQGAGGVHVPPDDYFKEIRAICDEYGVLLVADEVITGFGRTGKMFAMEHWGVTPDVLCFAKGVTSGYLPLGGVIITDKLHDEMIGLSEDVFLHGFTYSGHPTACAVALKNIEIIEKENLIENCKVMGERLLAGFRELEKKFEIVTGYRGLGLMAAIELKSPTGEQLALKVSKESIKRGLICRPIQHYGQDSLVFAPPIIINEQEVSAMLNILSDSLQTIQHQL